MDNENIDANLDIDSSSTSATGAIDQSKSANKSADIQIDTSAKKDGFDPKSIAEQIKAKYNIDVKSKADESLTDGKEVIVEDEKVKDKEEKKDNKKDESKEDSSVQKLNETSSDDSKLPFHNHPRFKQIIEERNKFEKELTEIKKYEEPAKRMEGVEKFCRDNNVTSADYDTAIRLAALYRSNPQEALTGYKKLVSALEIQTGSALPSDLQTQVDDGKLSLTHAQEIAKLRLEAAGSKHQAKQTSDTAAQRAQQELVNSLDSWTQAKIKSDPSFKIKQQGEEDGKYEFVTDKFLAMWQKEPPKDSAAAVRLAEQAYQTVHNWIEKNLPKPAQKRPMSSKRNEQPSDKPVDISKPGWAKEVAKRTLAGRN